MASYERRVRMIRFITRMGQPMSWGLMLGYYNIRCSPEDAILTSYSRNNQERPNLSMEGIGFAHTQSCFHDTKLKIDSQRQYVLIWRLGTEVTRSAKASRSLNA